MIKLNDWELAFISRFVEYYNLYRGSSVRMQTVMEILSKEMAIDPNKVISSFYTLLKKGLSIEPEALETLNGIISQELVDNLKRNGFSYPVLKFKFPKRTSYRDIKFRDNLLFSRGEDGLVRFWIYYQGIFYFLKEIGEIASGYAPYELLEDYLFYAIENKLLVYNVKSEVKITEKEFPSKIEAIELSGDVVYVYYGKIKQGVKIFDNEIVYKLADVYDKLPTLLTKIGLDDGFVIVHEGQIIYAKDNQKSFSKLREIDFPSENVVFIHDKNVFIKDNILYLYDLEKHSVVLSLSNEVTFCIKEHFLFSVDKANNLKIFDLHEHKSKKSIKLVDNVYSISAFGDFLVIGSDGYLVIFKLRDKFLVRSFDTLRQFKKIEISKGKVKILKAFDNYLFAYSDDGILKIIDVSNFQEVYTIKAFLNDILYTGKFLILIYDDRIEISKIDGKVQKTLNISVSSYLVRDKEVFLGTYDGFVKVLRLDDAEIDREFKVSDSEIKFISNYGNYIMVCDLKGFHIYTTNWEIIQILSYNPTKSITGIKKFDDYLSIAFKNGEIRTYHRDGSIKSVMKTKGFGNEEIVIDGDLKFYAFDDGYIVVKGNKFYGSSNYSDYIYFVDGYDVIMSDKFYEFYEDTALFDELSFLNSS